MAQGAFATESRRRAPRRALSCTECKRRKTRCSALGKTPCDACLARGRPQECRWESTPGESADNRSQSGVISRPTSSRSGSSSNPQRDLLTNQPTVTASAAPARSGLRYADTDEVQSTGFSPTHERRKRIRRVPDDSGLSAPTQSPHEAAAELLERTATAAGLDTQTCQAASRRMNHLVSEKDTERALPLDNDPDGVSPRTLAFLQRLQDVLPPLSTCNEGMEWYFGGPIHAAWPIIIEESFRLQTRDQLLKALVPMSNTAPDMLWLSVYLMILCLGIRFRPQTVIAEDVADRLYLASREAAELSDALSVPRVAHIELCLLQHLHLFHFGSSLASRNMAIRCLDIAITTAQWRDFDELARAQSPTVEQKHHQDLYNLLLFIDRTTRKRAQHCRLYPSSEADHRAGDGASGARFRLRPAASDFNLPQLGAQFAAIRARYPDPHMDEVASAGADDQLLVLLARLPGMAAMARDLSDTSSTWMTITLFCSIHNQLFRLHRRFVTADPADDRGRQRAAACVESAGQIIEAQELMMQCPQLRPSFTKRWVLNAAFILQVDSLHNRSQRTNEIRSPPGVLKALAIFQQGSTGDSDPALSATCAHAVECLISAARLAASNTSLESPQSSSDLLIRFFHNLELELSRFEAPDLGVPSVVNRLPEDDNTGQLWGLFDFENWNDWPIRSDADPRAFSFGAFA